ncbi:MAG: endonuclease domain-containing protein [Cetobacterium sp.]
MTKTTKRDAYLRKKYDISEEEYNHLLLLGHGGCWICGKLPKPGRSLNVDHDHHIQKQEGLRRSIRGLLCGFPCNKKFIGRNRREHALLYYRAALYLTDMTDITQDYLLPRTIRSYSESTDENKEVHQTRKRSRRKTHLK